MNKKGTTLLGEIVAFLFLIATGYMLSGAIIMAHGVGMVAVQATGTKIDYSLTMESGYFPVSHEIALMSFLETTDSNNIPMKTILTQAVVQKTDSPIVNGYQITGLQNTIEDDIFNGWTRGAGPVKYWLIVKVGNDNPIIDIKNAPEMDKYVFQKVSTTIYSPFEDGIIELYLFD